MCGLKNLLFQYFLSKIETKLEDTGKCFLLQFSTINFLQNLETFFSCNAINCK